MLCVSFQPRNITEMKKKNSKRRDQCSGFCEGSIIKGMCYRLFAEKMTWQDARESCNAWGGDLVSISSESDNLYINELDLPLAGCLLLAGNSRPWCQNYALGTS